MYTTLLWASLQDVPKIKITCGLLIFIMTLYNSQMPHREIKCVIWLLASMMLFEIVFIKSLKPNSGTQAGEIPVIDRTNPSGQCTLILSLLHTNSSPCFTALYPSPQAALALSRLRHTGIPFSSVKATSPGPHCVLICFFDVWVALVGKQKKPLGSWIRTSLSEIIH